MYAGLYTYQLHCWVFLIITTTTITNPRLLHNSEATDGSFLSVRWLSTVGLKWGWWEVKRADGQFLAYPVGNTRTRHKSAVW